MLVRRASKVLACAISFCAVCTSCSGSSEDGSGSGGNSSSSGDGDGDGTGTVSGDNVLFGTNDNGDSVLQDAFDVSADCVGTIVEGEAVPLDLYVMFDQSGSMLQPVEGEKTRLDAVREATETFLKDNRSEGIGIGIGYFGNQPIGSTSCDPTDYATPAVDIDTLPDQAGPILDSLADIEPTGETPTGAAIEGACSYLADYSKDNPQHRTAVLLVTDGVPEAPVTSMQDGGCSPTMKEAVSAATSCADSGLPVYVLGVGPNLGNLNDIAEAGGTDEAYLVEGGDVAARVLEALNAIRNRALPCQFLIPDPPEGDSIDFDYFNVVYTEPTADGEETYNIPYVADDNDCNADGGWHFDDSDNPTELQLCSATCSLVSSGLGDFQYAFGCARLDAVR